MVGRQRQFDRTYGVAQSQTRDRSAGERFVRDQRAPVAEQIGAQIFIDGWAIVAPGDPKLAARLAEQAARVSHDGAAVDAAKLWAAMEAEAFVSRDIDHLLEVGLAQISPESPIVRLIADVRRWRRQYQDWRDTRSQIEENYGYDKYPGNCHVVPNHAIMIMAVLYAPDDFAHAQTIVCTSGWDTDCNAGNVGCLIGAMLGPAGIDAGPDWRGPVADRMLLSSADGGGAINDAVRVTYRLVDWGGAWRALRRWRRRRRRAIPLLAPRQRTGVSRRIERRGYSARRQRSVRSQPGALRPLRGPRRRAGSGADAYLHYARRRSHAHL